MAEQKQIDSANADPTNPVKEFDEIFGPPEPVVGRAGRGFMVNNGCGDCASFDVTFARRGQIATIGYGIDDNVPMPWRRLCEMATLAKSFDWSSP